MIRINLLEQKKATKEGPKLNLGGVGTTGVIWLAVIVAAIGFIGLRWYSLNHQVAQVKEEIQRADVELERLQKALQTVDERRAKKEALEQRVTLISELKRRQRVPVHLLDQISKQLPEFLWLEGLEEREGGIQVRGKATTFNAVSNFYNNLRDSSFFSNVTMGTTQRVPEGVSFMLSCRFNPPVSGDETQDDPPPAGDAARS